MCRRRRKGEHYRGSLALPAHAASGLLLRATMFALPLHAFPYAMKRLLAAWHLSEIDLAK
jgi:hypothetical protein